MASKCLSMFFNATSSTNVRLWLLQERLLHVSPALSSVQSGKVKITVKKNKPVNYEDSFSPPHIAHRKSWNSWNTSTIEGGLKHAEITIEDMFIRKFLQGTFPSYILSKVIIKRQYNIIRVAFILNTVPRASRLYFLIGYSETLLGHFLQCNVKLEIQTLSDPSKMIFKKAKNAVQARKKLTDVYGEGVLTVRQCQNWFAKFRSDNFDVEDAAPYEEVKNYLHQFFASKDQKFDEHGIMLLPERWQRCYTGTANT